MTNELSWGVLVMLLVVAILMWHQFVTAETPMERYNRLMRLASCVGFATMILLLLFFLGKMI